MPTSPKPISKMLEKTTLVDADLFELVDSAETNKSLKNKKITAANMASYFGSVTVAANTWTPTSAHVTFSVADGYYYQVGNMVTVIFDITWPITTDTNIVVLSGLPVVPLTGTGTYNNIYNGSLFHFDTGAGSNNPVASDMTYILAVGSGSIKFEKDGATGTDGAIQNVYFSDKRVTGTITYIAA